MSPVNAKYALTTANKPNQSKPKKTEKNKIYLFVNLTKSLSDSTFVKFISSHPLALEKF